MSGGLVALLDDVAALARIAAASVDVAAGAAKAGAKAAGRPRRLPADET